VQPTIYLPSAVAARVIPRCLKRLRAIRAPGLSRAPMSGYSSGLIGPVSGRLLARSSSVSASYG